MRSILDFPSMEGLGVFMPDRYGYCGLIFEASSHRCARH
jgi:hypothetical protein